MEKKEHKLDKKKEPKDQELHIRMTKTEMDLLEMVSYESDNSKTDVVRKALMMYASAVRGHY